MSFIVCDKYKWLFAPYISCPFGGEFAGVSPRCLLYSELKLHYNGGATRRGVKVWFGSAVSTRIAYVKCNRQNNRINAASTAFLYNGKNAKRKTLRPNLASDDRFHFLPLTGVKSQYSAWCWQGYPSEAM